MKYRISVLEYVINEDGRVLDDALGGDLVFNDAHDFVMIWNFLKGSDKDIIDDGSFLTITPRNWTPPYVTEYQATGESYELLKKQEEERGKRFINEELDIIF